MTVYRLADKRPVEPEPTPTCTGRGPERVGSGWLNRKTECTKPGWWTRLAHGVRYGDVWECAHCSKKYRWLGDGWFTT